MRARMLAPAILLGLALLLPVPAAAQGGIALPEYRTEYLDNGMAVLLMRHPTVPLASLELWVGAGAARDPEGREGMASLVAGMLRKGAGDRDAASFSEQLDHLGARWSSGVDHDRTRVHLDLMARDLATGLELLADAVLRPTFDEGEFTRLRAQMAEQVVSAKENPRSVLGDYHRAHLYGDHPYGNPVDGSETSLPAITLEEAVAHHRAYYGSDITLLAIVGDIDPDATLDMVATRFGTMPRATGELRRLLPPAIRSGKRVLLVDKEDTPQTWFSFGSLGPHMQSPDYAATEVVATVFGGRFTSWLNTALRIESGLSYGAGFGFDRGKLAGPATVSSFTATATTREAIDLALEQLERLHDEGLDEEELASAKAYLRGQLPWDYETPDDLARAISELHFHDLGRDFVEQLLARIDAVTLEDCEAAIEAWFPRDNLSFTAIGVAGEVRGTMDRYGRLRVRDNTAPGFD